jgi:hypothetical protein
MTRALAVTLLLAFIAIGCERKNRRMHPDQQIGLIERCEQARRDALAAPEADRDQKIARWVAAVQDSKGLCKTDLHEALVMKDDKSHEVALLVMRRIDWKQHKDSFLSDLQSDRLTPEQQARVIASLKALSGQDLGDDRAAWQSWLRAQP